MFWGAVCVLEIRFFDLPGLHGTTRTRKIQTRTHTHSLRSFCFAAYTYFGVCRFLFGGVPFLGFVAMLRRPYFPTEKKNLLAFLGGGQFKWLVSLETHLPLKLGIWRRCRPRVVGLVIWCQKASGRQLRGVGAEPMACSNFGIRTTSKKQDMGGSTLAVNTTMGVKGTLRVYHCHLNWILGHSFGPRTLSRSQVVPPSWILSSSDETSMAAALREAETTCVCECVFLSNGKVGCLGVCSAFLSIGNYVFVFVWFCSSYFSEAMVLKVTETMVGGSCCADSCLVSSFSVAPSPENPTKLCKGGT